MLAVSLPPFKHLSSAEGLDGPGFHAKNAECAHGINAANFAFPKIFGRGRYG